MYVAGAICYVVLGALLYRALPERYKPDNPIDDNGSFLCVVVFWAVLIPAYVVLSLLKWIGGMK
jgi:integral membrane sensor domain MASE1